AAHGPRPQQRPPRLPDPLEPDARAERALAAGARPRQHRGPCGDGPPAGPAGPDPARPGAGAVPRGDVELEGADRRDDPQPAAPAGLLVRLGAHDLYDGSGLRRRRAGVLRAALPPGADP